MEKGDSDELPPCDKRSQSKNKGEPRHAHTKSIVVHQGRRFALNIGGVDVVMSKGVTMSGMATPSVIAAAMLGTSGPALLPQ